MRATLPAAMLLLAAAPAVADDGLGRAVGKALFERLWVPAPASTAATDGLGPHHDARSCAGCHPAGGPARLRPDAVSGELAGLGLVLRLGDASGRADPVYGRQLQRQAAPTLVPEAAWRLLLDKASGAPPSLAMEDLTLGTLTVPASPRAAPDLRGLGGLERVPDEAILGRADPEDIDGDGISGRPNRDPATGRLGRFGLKAAAPDIAAQTAAAFLLDLGLATPGLPFPAGDCTAAEADCHAAPQGALPGAPELSPAVVDTVASFLRGLPAPAVPSDATGRGLFGTTGCAACHAPELPTPRGHVPAGTDLLLHDLGPGLADGVGEGSATGAEWRTAPLVGIGRRLAAGGRLLHDGRAAGVAEAVGWHAGEAGAARARFEGLAPAERDALVAWLEAWR